MNEQPEGVLDETQAAAAAAADPGGTGGPQVTVDGQDLNELLAEYVALRDQDPALTEAQYARLLELDAILNLPPVDDEQPEQQQPIGVDPLALASDLLREAFLSLQAKPPAGQRLEHKIALGHAMAELVTAQATRNLMLLTQQQLQLVVQAQQAAAAKAAGPASILVPQSSVRLG